MITALNTLPKNKLDQIVLERSARWSCSMYCVLCTAGEVAWVWIRKRIVVETGQRDINGHQRKSKRSSRPRVPKMILKWRQLLIKTDTLYYLNNFLVPCGVYKTKLDFSFQNGGILFNCWWWWKRQFPGSEQILVMLEKWRKFFSFELKFVFLRRLSHDVRWRWFREMTQICPLLPRLRSPWAAQRVAHLLTLAHDQWGFACSYAVRCARTTGFQGGTIPSVYEPSSAPWLWTGDGKVQKLETNGLINAVSAINAVLGAAVN